MGREPNFVNGAAAACLIGRSALNWGKMEHREDVAARPYGLISVALRLGCALLACAGIAAARSALGPVEETAALRQALEGRVAAVLDAARETGAALGTPSGASVRAARRAKPAARRAAPLAAAPAVSALSPVFGSSLAAAPSAPAAAPAPVSSSPRGPPARA